MITETQQRHQLPPPSYQDDRVTLYTGDALDILSAMPGQSVDCVVTSPPYWGLRDYFPNHRPEDIPAGERVRRTTETTTNIGKSDKSTKVQRSV